MIFSKYSWGTAQPARDAPNPAPRYEPLFYMKSGFLF